MKNAWQSSEAPRVEQCLWLARFFRGGYRNKAADPDMAAVFRQVFESQIESWYFSHLDPGWLRSAGVLRRVYEKAERERKVLDECVNNAFASGEGLWLSRRVCAGEGLKEGGLLPPALCTVLLYLDCKPYSDYQKVVRGVALRFGLRPEDVAEHIEKDHPVFWRRFEVGVHWPTPENPEPAHVFTKFFSPVTATSGLKAAVQLPGVPVGLMSRYAERLPAELPGWRPRQRATSMQPSTINRSLCIYYMSHDGGGPLTQDEACRRWEVEFDEYSTGNYEAQIKQILDARRQRIEESRQALRQMKRPFRGNQFSPPLRV